MSEKRPGWVDEDLQPVTVSAPDQFAFTTERPVRAVEVRDGDVVLGYLWAAVGEEAAGFEVRPAAGGPAMNAAVHWYEQLRAARASGVAADDLLAWLGSAGETNRANQSNRSADQAPAGRPDPATEHEVESLARLRAAATGA